MNVSGKIQKFRASVMLCLNAAPIRSLALFLFSGLLLTGCSTALTYKPNMAAGPARPVGYPIPVYTEHMTVPRPCEVIGTISIGDRTLTMFGGSFESEMEKVMQNAWEKGADAVQVTSVEKPDFTAR